MSFCLESQIRPGKKLLSYKNRPVCIQQTDLASQLVGLVHRRGLVSDVTLPLSSLGGGDVPSGAMVLVFENKEVKNSNAKFYLPGVPG